MLVFPTSILLLFGEISAIKGTKIDPNNGKEEVEVHAPDPDEVDEKEEQKVFKLFEKLKEELAANGFKTKTFSRGEGIDAIRIYL